MLQWCKCSVSCKTPLFSGFQNKSCFDYILLPLFSSFFCSCHKLLKMQDVSPCSFKIWLCWNSFFKLSEALYLHLPYVGRTLQLSRWSPYLSHLKCLKVAGMYCPILTKQYPFITSLGITDLLNIRIYECLCIFFFSDAYLFVVLDLLIS